MKVIRSRAFTTVTVLVVGAVCTLMLFMLWQNNRATAESQTDAVPESADSAKKQVPVVLAPAKLMTFDNRIEVSGSVSAERYSLVSARIPGTLDEVFVDEGDRVVAGKTQLFQTDSLTLIKAQSIAEHDLTVAECSVREKEAQLERLIAKQEQACNDVRRYRELAKRNAISTQALEQQESQCKQSAAEVKHARALITLAEAQVEQARLGLTIAKKNLTDSLVMAPISGRVSQRFREPGEMAGAGTPVLRIEDLATLEVSVFLPEECYALVILDKTKMRIKVGSIDLGARPVSYKSPTVHNKLRTFEVKGLVESPPPGVVPGRLARVAVVTDSRRGVGVPSGAVQARGGKNLVFTVVQDRAKAIPVKIGRQTQGYSEVVEGIKTGVPVIAMGQFLVEDGTPISIVQEDAE